MQKIYLRSVLHIASIFSLLGLASCAFLNYSKTFKGPTGKVAYSIQCNQMGYSVDACYRRVGENCPNGYEIIPPPSGVGVPGRGGMTSPHHLVAVECK